MPLLLGAAIRILPVAPLQLVVAPMPATPLTRSHSQIICQHALINIALMTMRSKHGKFAFLHLFYFVVFKHEGNLVKIPNHHFQCTVAVNMHLW